LLGNPRLHPPPSTLLPLLLLLLLLLLPCRHPAVPVEAADASHLHGAVGRLPHCQQEGG
jgi:hypothetical protein